MIHLIIKCFLLAFCGILYRMGGSDEFDKGVRRFGVPGLILINTIIQKSWLGIASYPLLALALSMGYGVNSKLMKWTKNKYLTRFICGLLYAVAALPILWGNWWLFGWHIFAVTSWVTLNGNQKFKFSDIIEEGGMGLLIGLCPILMS